MPTDAARRLAADWLADALADRLEAWLGHPQAHPAEPRPPEYLPACIVLAEVVAALRHPDDGLDPDLEARLDAALHTHRGAEGHP